MQLYILIVLSQLSITRSTIFRTILTINQVHHLEGIVHVKSYSLQRIVLVNHCISVRDFVLYKFSSQPFSNIRNLQLVDRRISAYCFLKIIIKTFDNKRIGDNSLVAARLAVRILTEPKEGLAKNDINRS